MDAISEELRRLGHAVQGREKKGLAIRLFDLANRCSAQERELEEAKAQRDKARNMARHNYRCAVHEQINVLDYGGKPSQDYPPLVDDEYAAGVAQARAEGQRAMARKATGIVRGAIYTTASWEEAKERLAQMIEILAHREETPKPPYPTDNDDAYERGKAEGQREMAESASAWFYEHAQRLKREGPRLLALGEGQELPRQCLQTVPGQGRECGRELTDVDGHPTCEAHGVRYEGGTCRALGEAQRTVIVRDSPHRQAMLDAILTAQREETPQQTAGEKMVALERLERELREETPGGGE